MRQQNCEWLFYCFNIERNYDVSKNLCILLYKNVNFKKNEMQSEMENPAHSFRQTNLVLQLVWESQIKNKTVMSLNSWKKKEGIFYTIYFVQIIFFSHLSFTSMDNVLNILSKYTYFFTSKVITSYTFLFVSKIVESLPWFLKNGNVYCIFR